jgi:hypothetical protein
VERKHKRGVGAPAPKPAPTPPRATAPIDRGIRAWNDALDLERREEAKFNALAEHEKITAAITAACEVLKARLRGVNDPRVEREYGTTIVGRDLLEASVRNFQVLPRAPQGECAVVYCHPGQLGNLGRALSMLLPKTTKGVNDPKAPPGQGDEVVALHQGHAQKDGR